MRIITIFLLFLLSGAALAEPQVYTREIITGTYKIDKIYRSMMGPYGTESLKIRDGDRELLWIVGYEAEVIDGKEDKVISQEFMCHSNLDYKPESYGKINNHIPWDGRFFTLSQGMQNVRFPAGCGIPIYSNEEIDLNTQVLNLNDPHADRRVRYRVQIHYLRDQELDHKMVALRQFGVQGLKSLTGKTAYWNQKNADEKHHGPGCAVGSKAVKDTFQYEDSLGQKFTAHWVVPPGRDTNSTLVTRYLGLTEDVRVYYIAVHLHPYAESLELKDLTTGKTIFKSLVTPAKGRIGIEKIEDYSDPKGMMLYKDHEYELVSVYNNTTDHDVDSMAVLYLYSGFDFKPKEK
ncbi:MAG: hypothetical protein AB7S38_10820 [Vulcanimicrobiota bacterium]